MASPHGLRRGRLERLDAWLRTGPLGHLWSVALDVAAMLARYAVTRAGRRTGRPG